MIRSLVLGLVAALGVATAGVAQDADNILVIDVGGSVTGTVEIALRPDVAPRHVERIKELARASAYNDVVFHRVIDGFMIQGGDPTGTGRGGPGYEFADEFHGDLSFSKPYLLAMANAGPGTNGSQFFITVGKTPHLNRKHTIFGEVTDPASQQVVDQIAGTATDRFDRPTDDVVIESITVSDPA